MIFSSWKLTQTDDNSHRVHHGTAMIATGVQTTIDDFVKERDFDKLDFIKVDTDGHELDVIRGAIHSISKFRPVVVFELTLYLLDEQQILFSQFEDIFSPMNYRLMDTKSGRNIRQNNYREIVPPAGSIDVAAIPERQKYKV